MPGKKKVAKEVETGVFGTCHIFASFNDTFVHVTAQRRRRPAALLRAIPAAAPSRRSAPFGGTARRAARPAAALGADLSGRETYVRATGGMKVKADRDESSPYSAAHRRIVGISTDRRHIDGSSAYRRIVGMY
eukprot:gene4473-15856_t